MEKKVSVIMPVYNSGKYIEKSIKSFVGQTLEDTELICVNDCSKDNSVSIIKRYIKLDKRIRLINNKDNIGPGPSRNKGILAAKGKYICFLDSDDWLEEDACEKLYKKAEENNADIVYIRPKLVFADKILQDKRLLNQKELESKDRLFKKNLLRQVAWAPWSKMVSKNLLIKNKLFFPEVHVAEDIIFSLKAIYYANKVSECKDYLYNYYIREGSLMAFTNSKRRIENYLKSIDLVKHFLVKKNIFRKYEKEFLYFKFYNYLAIYGVMYYSKEELEKEHYKKIIEKDRDFSGIKILSLGINSVALGSILIKMKLFNPVFRIRELFRILVGRWGKRNL